MRSYPLLAALCTFAMASLIMAQELTVQALPSEPGRPMSFKIDPGQSYKNPFDPDEVAIEAVVTSGESTYRMPAFWFQRYTATLQGQQQAKVEGGESFWMLRLCPDRPGDLVVEVKDASGVRKSKPLAFTPPAGQSRRGFVRIAPNKRYFQLDSGAPLFIVGINMSWGKYGRWADEFDGWFTRLAGNGGNFARVWMSEGRWRLEPPGGTLGKYDMAAAAFYDDVLASAGKHGIYVMLTFLNHRDLLVQDMWGKAPWPDSPYNAAKGGPATRPVDFFTNPDARKAFQKRLRYIVARYAAYPSLGFWELFNEQEHAGLGGQAAWNGEMSKYVAQLDPYLRPVSTSSSGLPAEVWQSPSIAFTQVHYYGDDTTVDLISPVLDASRKAQAFAKPQLVAEFGISYKRSDLALDKRLIGTSLHNSLWAGMVSGSAGGACHWWWDSYVDPKGLWTIYKPFADFTGQIDFAKGHYLPMGSLMVERTDAPAEQFGDAVIPCTLGWQKADGQTITINERGRANHAVPQFLWGPEKRDMRAPTTLAVDLPRDCEMLIRIGTVSDYGVIRVRVDGVAKRDFLFSALPGAEEIESTKPFNQTGPYQAIINKEKRLPIPAGKHTIELQNLAGDWIKIDTITFTRSISARYANVNACGLQDRDAGSAIVWLYDDRSNWRSDNEDLKPEALKDVAVTVPLKQDGAYEVIWWDTRKGGEIARQKLQSEGKLLRLLSPQFTRDIAARLQIAR